MRDQDFATACQTLLGRGFRPTAYPYRLDSENLSRYVTLWEGLLTISTEGQAITWSGVLFEWPDHASNPDRCMVAVFPNILVRLPMVDQLGPLISGTMLAAASDKYDIYRNIYYPSAAALLESLVCAMMLQGNPYDASSWTTLGQKLHGWIEVATIYLNIDPEALGDCPNRQALQWYMETLAGPDSGFRLAWLEQHCHD